MRVDESRDNQLDFKLVQTLMIVDESLVVWPIMNTRMHLQGVPPKSPLASI